MSAPTPPLRGVSVGDWQRRLRDLDLDPMTKYVGMVLSTYADLRTGAEAYPSQPTLARACGISVRTVGRHLKVLREDLMLVERVRRGSSIGKANTSDGYRLVIPDDVLDRVPISSTTTGHR